VSKKRLEEAFKALTPRFTVSFGDSPASDRRADFQGLAMCLEQRGLPAAKAIAKEHYLIRLKPDQMNELYELLPRFGFVPRSRPSRFA